MKCSIVSLCVKTQREARKCSTETSFGWGVHVPGTDSTGNRIGIPLIGDTMRRRKSTLVCGGVDLHHNFHDVIY